MPLLLGFAKPQQAGNPSLDFSRVFINTLLEGSLS
jgi:hypothetical protein